jgi:chemotaxis protein methyltransferase CheR
MNRLSDVQLQGLSDLVAHRFGLHFPPERWRHLESVVCGAAHEWDLQHDVNHYLEQLLSPASTEGQLEVLANYLTVSETYFWREKRSLEIFETHVVPELIRTRPGKTIGVWSAGCATGEEPYSIAILLSKWMAGLKTWNIDILATDLNSKSLQKASAGIYGEWSFRETPPSLRSAYFDPVGANRWMVRAAIRKMVRFSRLNLVDDFLPQPLHPAGGFDVIFCRNVLMYLTAEAMRKVIERLYRSLASDGWLIVSPVEMSHRYFSEFAAVDFGGVTLYRKSDAPVRPALTSPPVVPAENCFAGQPPEQRLETLVCNTSRASQGEEIQSNDTEKILPASNRNVSLRCEPEHREPAQNGNDAQAMLLLARAQANQGQLAAALRLCDQAIATAKMAARAYYLRGTILQEQGAMPEALIAFRQTVYADPQFVLGHFALAHLALSGGRLRESEKHFENVLLLLAHFGSEDIVPESEGLSAGCLRQMIASRRGAPSGRVPGRPAEARAERARSQ